ncbi:MAG: hypothetical protein EBS01_12835 [Verrucomicrobia bacterium]|nr:hypothetical protein [Verrucomicrobiota bacterium]
MTGVLIQKDGHFSCGLRNTGPEQEFRASLAGLYAPCALCAVCPEGLLVGALFRSLAARHPPFCWRENPTKDALDQEPFPFVPWSAGSRNAVTYRISTRQVRWASALPEFTALRA